MTLITRYITSEFLKILGLCLSGLFLVLLVVDFFEKMRRYAHYEPSIETMLIYFTLRLPQMIMDISPVAIALSAVLTLGLLSRRNEIIAMKGMGITSLRIIAPFIIISLFISFILLVLNASFIPTLKKQTDHVKQFQIRKKPATVFFRRNHIWLQVNPLTFMSVNLADSQTSSLLGVHLFKLDSNFSLSESIEADKIDYRDNQWIISKGIRRKFLSDGSIQTESLQDTTLKLDRQPDDFIQIQKNTKGMTIHELQNYIEKLDRHSLPAHRYRVDFYTKTALPFIGFAFVIVGVPLSMRQGLKQSISRSVGVVLIMALIYWIILSLSISLGYGRTLPPFLSAWLPNGLFIAVGLTLIRKMD